jgi:hypothetical protein
MACCCNSLPCGCSARFTVLTGDDLKCSLAISLIPVADDLRDLLTQTGMRPYVVHFVRTRWSGGSRGDGVEQVVYDAPILPTPLVSDLSALNEIVNPVGLDEVGGIVLSEVSGAYTEEQLLGRGAGGEPIPPDEQFYYEIEFTRTDGRPAERRRFFIRSAPSYQPSKFQWTVSLERSHEDRTRLGEPE